MQAAEDLVKENVALEVALFPQCTDEENNLNDVVPPACDIDEREASSGRRNRQGAGPHFHRCGSSHQRGTGGSKQSSEDQTLKEDHGLHDIGESGSRRLIEDQTVEFEHEATS